MIHTIDENPFVPLMETLFTKEYNYTGPLDNLHILLDTNTKLTNKKGECIKIYTLGKDDRNLIFVKNFHDFVDESPDFTAAYHAFLRQHVQPLFPNEKLVIQKTPNIRFSFPESAAIGKHEHENPETSDVIGFHKDNDFGHHPIEMNFIVPVTPMFDTNSVYYEPTANSNLPVDQYNNLKLSTSQFFQGYLNQWRHYNRINRTNKTRISYDLRVIPYTKYMEHWDDFQGTKFELGKYYIIL